MDIEQTIVKLFPHDKCLHFIAGVVIFACAHFSLHADALYVVLALASAKELYDSSHRGDSSKYDIFATVAGGIIGYLCGMGG